MSQTVHVAPVNFDSAAQVCQLKSLIAHYAAGPTGGNKEVSEEVLNVCEWIVLWSVWASVCLILWHLSRRAPSKGSGALEQPLPS